MKRKPISVREKNKRKEAANVRERQREYAERRAVKFYPEGHTYAGMSIEHVQFNLGNGFDTGSD